jgi:hypothetical protein
MTREGILKLQSLRDMVLKYTDYLVTAKFRERLRVTNEAAQMFDEDRLNHKKLSVLEVKKQYQIIISKYIPNQNHHPSTEKN